jgi:hypothetical protein
MMSYQTKALEGIEELKEEEIQEIMSTLLWFMSLMKEFQVSIPEEAKEKITSIKRFFDMAQVQASTGSPYQAMIGKKDP